MSSIRLRLLVSLVALLVLVAAAMAAITYRNVLGETEAIFDYQLQQMALSLRDQGEISAAQADSIADAQLDFVIQIWTVDGRSIYASRPHSSLPARALLGLATLQVEGRAWRTYSVGTRERVIQVAQPVEIRERLAAHAAWRSVLPLLLIAPLAVLVAWWLAAKHLAPLSRLADELRARDAQSLAPLANGGLPDELAPLADSLNALLERLRLSLDAQRDFVADVAHELRSPLTALKPQPSSAAPQPRRRAKARRRHRARRGWSSSRCAGAQRTGRGRADPQRVDSAEIARRMVPRQCRSPRRVASSSS
jgi:two-component system OmpR family sensor kinase/two-component system sensor histidine kinase QseC